MATSPVKPPPGFVVEEQPSQSINLPPGFILDRRQQLKQQELPTAAGFIKNVPASLGRLIVGVAQAVTSPVQTAKGLGKLATADPEAWGAMTEILKERYGGTDKLLRTIYDDPAGVAADISAIFAGGGGALRGLGVIAKAPKLVATGRAVESVAAATDPLRTAARVTAEATGPIRQMTGRVATGLIGGTTGAGPEAFRTASETMRSGTPAQLAALKGSMRGRISEMDVLQNVRDALQEAKDIRGTNYQTKLAQVKTVKVPLTMDSARKSVAEGLRDFKVQTRIDAKGNMEFDFSRSPIRNPKAQAEITEIAKTVDDWGTQADDLTPLGMDTLKRRVADVYSETSQARAFSERVGSSIRHELVVKVPGYADMTKDYATASKLIESVTGELSLGSKNSGAAIRKLQYALKQNNNYRQVLVESLENFTGNETLKQQLAGTMLSRATPRGIVGEMAAAAIIAGTVFGTLNPKMVVSLAAHSPRVMGELFVALGEMRRLAASPTAQTIARPLATPGAYRPLQIPGAIEKREATQ